jgi:rhodanese-related sulfurtransferase
MKASSAALVLLLAMSFGATESHAQYDSDPIDPAMAMAAATPIQTIAPSAVWKLRQRKDANIVLVDTQPHSGFAESHIPGAINYPWVMRITKFPISLPRNKTLIFYGCCENDTRSIVKQLAEYGYFNVKIMDGGLYKWAALKYPVTRATDSDDPDLPQAAALPRHHDN